MRLEKRKVIGTKIIETYSYALGDSKKEFFNHHHSMRQKGFKSDRNNDHSENSCFFVTYEKNVEAAVKEPVGRRR